MIKLTRDEWLLTLAAYAYEILNDPIMSDGHYDLISKYIINSNIPDYTKDSGIWIHAFSESIPDIELYISKYRELGLGTGMTHIIPNEFILDLI